MASAGDGPSMLAASPRVADHIRGSPAAVFHNGDIYPDAYDTVIAVTYSKSDAPVTVADRLLPVGESHRLDRFVYWVVSAWPFGKAVRQVGHEIVEPSHGYKVLLADVRRACP